jgi:hypothetical protein
MATQECPISEKHKRFLVETDPTNRTLRERALVAPRPEEIARVMAERDSMPEQEWLVRLERVMLKESPDMPEGFSKEELEAEALRMAPGSLAVGVIDRVPSIKEFMETLIREAEALRRRWSVP